MEVEIHVLKACCDRLPTGLSPLTLSYQQQPGRLWGQGLEMRWEEKLLL